MKRTKAAEVLRESVGFERQAHVVPSAPEAAPRNIAALCVFCKHWRFDGGSPDYSELTLGDEATIGCAKKHWPCPSRAWAYSEEAHPLHNYSEYTFREAILCAQTCPDYEQVKP